MEPVSIKEYARLHKLSIYNVVKMAKEGKLQTQTRSVEGKDELFILTDGKIPVLNSLSEATRDEIKDYENAYYTLKAEHEELKKKYEALKKNLC